MDGNLKIKLSIFLNFGNRKINIISIYFNEYINKNFQNFDLIKNIPTIN
jgi:hypothetical protein